MHIDILSVVPNLLAGAFDHSIMKKAQDKGLLTIKVHDLRAYTPYKHGQVDDYQFGGGAGMVLMPEPLAIAIGALQKERTYDEIIYLTPDGETLKQGRVNALSLKGDLLMICGHYKGIDERIREHYITLELSIGDYVISGGELAAAVLTDAIGRLIPGVLGDSTSALSDSFQDQRLAAPLYTRPANFKGWEVPPVLLEGNHKLIDEWRRQQALERTKQRRPDLLE